MSIQEMMAVDDTVRRMFGVKAHESVRDAATRIIRSGEFGSRRLAASVILNRKRAPWEAMALAAQLLQRGKVT